jgi:hypothetical protein
MESSCECDIETLGSVKMLGDSQLAAQLMAF